MHIVVLFNKYDEKKMFCVIPPLQLDLLIDGGLQHTCHLDEAREKKSFCICKDGQEAECIQPDSDVEPLDDLVKRSQSGGKNK